MGLQDQLRDQHQHQRQHKQSTSESYLWLCLAHIWQNVFCKFDDAAGNGFGTEMLKKETCNAIFCKILRQAKTEFHIL